jgi:predicted ester cyclase
MKKLLALVFIVFLACFVLGGQQTIEKGACEKKAQVLLDKVLEMWNKPDLELIPQLYTADCVALTSSTPEPYAGHEGIRKWIENTRTMFPDMVMAFPEVMVQGDKIATIWTLTGTHNGPMVTPGGTLPPTGKKVHITGLSIDYLQDGKFKKEIVVFNMLEMLMPMGFGLVPPAAGNSAGERPREA